MGPRRWLITAVLAGGCSAYHRARLDHYLAHPLDALASRWLWLGVGLLVAAGLVVGLVLLRTKPKDER